MVIKVVITLKTRTLDSAYSVAPFISSCRSSLRLPFDCLVAIETVIQTTFLTSVTHIKFDSSVIRRGRLTYFKFPWKPVLFGHIYGFGPLERTREASLLRWLRVVSQQSLFASDVWEHFVFCLRNMNFPRRDGRNLTNQSPQNRSGCFRGF